MRLLVSGRLLQTVWSCPIATLGLSVNWEHLCQEGITSMREGASSCSFKAHIAKIGLTGQE